MAVSSWLALAAPVIHTEAGLIGRQAERAADTTGLGRHRPDPH